MTLVPQMKDQMKEAMKARDTLVRDTLRMLLSEIGKAEIQKGDPLTEAEEVAVLLKAQKTRTESADQYAAAGRDELAEKERAEIEVIQRFLPKPMSEAEAKEAISGLAAKHGYTEKKDMGALMKAVKEHYAGRIDGKLASKLAAQVLS
jgi:uncharacterized protein